ncbi:MAG: hypothetical protein ACLFUJ_02300 [Phycisphaerae bacterium]
MAKSDKTTRKSKTRPDKPKRKTSKLPAPKEPSAIGRWWNHLDEPSRQRVRARAGWLILAVLAAIPASLALSMAEDSILSGQKGPVTRRYVIRLANAPYWMPPATVEQIHQQLRPENSQFNDVDLARRVYELADRNPWIAKVGQVRKFSPREDGQPGRVTVQADFREPFTRVLWADSRGERPRCYVDRHGVVLPAAQVPLYRTGATEDSPQGVFYAASAALPTAGTVRELHYVTVGGLAEPAVTPGNQWAGQDIQAALDLVAALASRPYYKEIFILDISNYQSRRTSRASEIVLHAREGRSGTTRIDFGRLPRHNGDYVVSVDRKLDNLQQIYEANGRTLIGIDAVIDLRHDPPRPTPREIQRARQARQD